MSVHKLAQAFEISIWNFLIPYMEEEGFIMKGLQSIKQTINPKVVYLVLLVLLWAKVGFVAGMLAGRMIWIIQVR